MAGEILAELWHDVSGEPLRFGLEVLQFAILAVLVYGIGWGIGKRRGFVRNMLAESQQATIERVQRAQAMPDELAQARDEAANKKREARAQARKLVAEARLEAERLTAEGEARADTEAERLLHHAEEALENEREESQAAVRERLIDVVARSTRAIMNERMSIAEQRKLIEGAVLASVSDGQHAPGRADGRSRTGKPTGASRPIAGA